MKNTIPTILDFPSKAALEASLDYPSIEPVEWIAVPVGTVATPNSISLPVNTPEEGLRIIEEFKLLLASGSGQVRRIEQLGGLAIRLTSARNYYHQMLSDVHQAWVAGGGKISPQVATKIFLFRDATKNISREMTTIPKQYYELLDWTRLKVMGKNRTVEYFLDLIEKTKGMPRDEAQKVLKKIIEGAFTRTSPFWNGFTRITAPMGTLLKSGGYRALGAISIAPAAYALHTARTADEEEKALKEMQGLAVGIGASQFLGGLCIGLSLTGVGGVVCFVGAIGAGYWIGRAVESDVSSLRQLLP
jgi:hypothetical protein